MLQPEQNMQAHPQLSGQVPGQVPGQLAGVSQQNTAGLQSQGTWRTWQTVSDVGMRRTILEKILQLFQKRRPHVTSEWQQKLPDFVKRLEESLYRDAPSKEEYSDLTTLEHRLQAVARRLAPGRSNPNYAARGSNISPTSMIPTPGVSKGSTMIPTPGSEMTVVPTPGTGTLSTNVSGSTVLQGRGITASGMVPTPGLGSHVYDPSAAGPGSSMAMSHASASVGPNMDVSAIQQQTYNSGTSGHMYRNINGQVGGSMANNMQRKNHLPFEYGTGATGNGMQLMGSEQHVVSGNLGFPNSVQFGNVSAMQSQQLMKQQQQPHYIPMQSRIPGQMGTDGYASSTNDITGLGHYNPASTGMSHGSLGMHSQGVSKMIPVPGLPPQQSQQPAFQADKAHQSKIAGATRNYQQHQILKTKSPYQAQLPSELYGKKPNSSGSSGVPHDESQPVPGSVPPLSSQFQSSQEHQSLQRPQNLLNHPQTQLSNEQETKLNQPADNTTQIWHSKDQNEEPHQMEGKPQLQCHSEAQLPGQQQQSSEQQVPQSNPQSSGTQIEMLQDLRASQNSTGHQALEGSAQSLQPQDVSVGNAEEQHKSVSSKAANGQGTGVNSSSTSSSTDSQRYLKQQRWLLFLRHASKCTALKDQCQSTPHCDTAKQLWAHITSCTNRECLYPRCQPSKALIKHHHQCRDVQCPVCAPVRQRYMQRTQAVQSQGVQAASPFVSPNVHSNVSQSATLAGPANSQPSARLPTNVTDFQPPPAKRPKTEPADQLDPCQLGPDKSQTSLTLPPHAQMVTLGVKTDTHTVLGNSEEIVQATATTKSDSRGAVSATMQAGTQVRSIPTSQRELEPEVKHAQVSNMKVDSTVITNKVSVQVKQDAKQEATASTSSPGHDSAGNHKVSKPKIKGVSLTELFTPEQIREHIVGLRQWVGQSKAKAEKNQAMEHRMNENSCQLCAVETLTFEPPPIYCTPCGARIKRNAFYWTMQFGETRHYFCIPCYNDVRSDTVEIDGVNHPKSKLEKRKNDEEVDEPWVQCDKCEKWQHQVCALFNARRNEGGQAEYTCPSCLMEEIENGLRKPLPQSAVLGAKDLPRTFLSDHIELRLARRLKQERQLRAEAQKKAFDEVPGADSLVVRIVSSVDKRLEVKQRFLEIFQEEDYPTEFPYKSKVLLLFQKIEGVEVCLFGMYVQEFGAESAQPNQRRVYLSYLDSVKYFRPDVRTVDGEALRTFVYHEILIGYLEYCKSRGFTSCYIWACPPLKGEDYILYCHPEIQKTPRSDKLREWYLTMLRKAANEDVVVEVTNMYDHFFVRTGEAQAKVTAARLPYFDGDYWPGAAEDMIMQLHEEESGRRQQKKGKTKKTATKRATKAAAHAELASNASKDLQLMHKLGESILPMKEDFIMVHLQYACTHCCNFILSGRFWICKLCKNFRICDGCYATEQKLDDRDRHPVNSKEAHQLCPVERNEPLADTKDKDEITESEFFDTRQAFLSLCQGNHYQYDTLRRAKHSSMMVLYHLHNPTAPAFVTTCNMCNHDIETGQGWRCETCPDFDICNSCYSKDNTVKHPHKLSPHPSAADRDAQSKEARQQRVLQLRKMLDLLVHASQCGSGQCTYPNCRRVKGLFRHGMVCKTRASGGCHLCKKMWYLLQLHARACKESECRVPRCRDLKEHLRRLQRQMESRRRAAVKEMMRQRTAEAAAGLG